MPTRKDRGCYTFGLDINIYCAGNILFCIEFIDNVILFVFNFYQIIPKSIGQVWGSIGDAQLSLYILINHRAIHNPISPILWDKITLPHRVSWLFVGSAGGKIGCHIII